VTFEEWHEENFGPVQPGVPFHLAVLKQAYEEGAKNKQWVGLTDEEIMEIVGQITSYRGEYMVCVGNAIEAKLREKNGG
jgi:alkylhydroperoxidase/carboxymuconolactone decarboxylase family protein YurZ